MKKLMLVAAIAACGGGSGSSGVDGSEKVTALTPAQQMAECQYLFDTYPPRTVTCSAQLTITLGEKSVAACLADYQTTVTNNPNCMLTVAQAEACIAAESDLTDTEVCASTSSPAACAPLAAAECSSQG